MASFLVIGMGRFGSSVASQLFKLGHEVMALDKNEEYVSRIMDSVTNTIIGDANDESVLNSLSVRSFDCAIVSIAGAIDDSILITLMLKEMGVKKIVCKAQDERHAKILSLIGADEIVRPEYEMGMQVAQKLVCKNIIGHIEISPEHSVVEVLTPKQWSGKSIKKNDLRRRYGITVIAVRAVDSDRMKLTPNPEFILNQGDVLTVIGSTQDINDINDLR